MLIEVEFLIVAALAALLLILSILDFALTGVNKIALRRIADAPPGRGRALKDSLVDERTEVLMAIHISIQTILIAIAVFLTDFSLRYAGGYALALPLAGGATLVLVLLFRQLLPRAIALRDPEAVLDRLAFVLGLPYFLLRPLVRMIMAILSRFHAWDSGESKEEEEEASDEEIQAFIDAGQEEGILEQDEGAMIQSIVQFGDKVALEVMTPRPQIVAAEMAWGVEKVIELILESRHSRIPVYRGELDNIEGIIHERDLLRMCHTGEEPDLRRLMHPAHFVPETKPVDDLLEEMKTHSRQMTIVVDEYGGIAGLITIEDLIEEIVGEIGDGPDAAGTEMVEESVGAWLIPAGTELDAMEVRLGRPVFPDTECTTVGGAVVELFGRLPSSGERIRHDGLSIEVVDADRRKVNSVRVREAGADSEV
jgi:CBS domain containing-hemolysin-like protein